MTIEEIKELPVEEKFLIMETLWDDLRERYESSEVPDEHKKLLDLRRDQFDSGELKMFDWDEVKSSLGAHESD